MSNLTVQYLFSLIRYIIITMIYCWIILETSNSEGVNIFSQITKIIPGLNIDKKLLLNGTTKDYFSSFFVYKNMKKKKISFNLIEIVNNCFHLWNTSWYVFKKNKKEENKKNYELWLIVTPSTDDQNVTGFREMDPGNSLCCRSINMIKSHVWEASDWQLCT